VAIPTILYECETWAIREQEKCRKTSAEIKFMMRAAKCRWQDYKTNDGILSELKKLTQL
jgi:hypothetical protein